MESKGIVGGMAGQAWQKLSGLLSLHAGHNGQAITDLFDATGAVKSGPSSQDVSSGPVTSTARTGDAQAAVPKKLGCPYMDKVAAGQKPPTGTCPVMDIKAPGDGANTALVDDVPQASKQHLEELGKVITDLQNALQKAGVVDDIGRLFHRKQLWGGMAELNVKPGVSNLVQNSWVGAAQNGAPLKVAMRFSDGLPCPGAGIKPDVRGLAMKIQGPDGKLRDVLMTNGINPAMNTEEFVEFAKIITKKTIEGNIAAVKQIIGEVQTGHYKTPEVLRMAQSFGWDTRPRYQHPAGQSYWSQPMQLGSVMGRFRVDAVQGDASKPGVVGMFKYFTDPDYERHAVEKDLGTHDVHLKLTFEAFKDNVPLHQQAVRGNHVDEELGTITIKKRDAASPRRTEEEELVNNMQFNQGHGASADYHPVGTMRETRTKVYETSAGNRHALTDASPEVQRFFGLPEDPGVAAAPDAEHYLVAG